VSAGQPESDLLAPLTPDRAAQFVDDTHVWASAPFGEVAALGGPR